MGFLDNSGNIKLDATMTDNGRKLLSKGDGSFRITKFALADDEIDYALYNKTHPSGSPYYDLEILQSPVLESFTNNSSTMKCHLLTYDNLELLYLPVLRLSEVDDNNRSVSDGAFYVLVDRNTEDNEDAPSTFSAVGVNDAGHINQGMIFGASYRGSVIKVDAGLDTSDEVSPQVKIEPELVDNSFIVQMDSRLGFLINQKGQSAEPDYVDDDSIAFYTLDLNDTFVTSITDVSKGGNVIRGPRGNRIEFRIAASTNLNTSSYLFNTLGGEGELVSRKEGGATMSPVQFIDTTVRISGVKTGIMIDIPIRYIKLA
jgi:hypothetical protein